MTQPEVDLEKLQKDFDQAVEQHRAGDREAAHAVYLHVHEADPSHSGALHMLGVVALQEERGAEAEAYLRQAIEIEPDNSKILNNLGNSYYLQRKFQAAADTYLKAHAAVPEESDPTYNLGTALYELGNFTTAIKSFETVLMAEPHHVAARLNLGVCLKELKQFTDAIACFEKILADNPDDFDALINLAIALIATEKWEKAEEIFGRASKLQSNHVGVRFELLRLAQRACNFTDVAVHFEVLLAQLPAQLEYTTDWQFLASLAYQNIFTPLPSELHSKIQSRFDELVTPEYISGSFSSQVKTQADKIRIGYMSSNFGDHPVGHVTSALFQAHDRRKFEIYGFSLSDRMAEHQNFADNLKNDFDGFYQIGGEAPRRAAEIVNEIGIQILVDLDGFMSSKGLRIQAHRPAPIQLFWLGHAGGVGQSYVDYLIADRLVVPEDEQENYRDKIVYLPDVYHSAAMHPIANEVPPRSHFGLPETGPIFCAFNNPEKIDSTTFGCWMEILRGVPESVLWLSSMRGWPTLESNLKTEAERLDVVGDRLIFADRIADKSAHLARHRHASLFLDTFTLNASTTALDSLWAGLPILAVAGDRFASRISQTMLQATGLSEMIFPDQASYVDRAIEIATDPAEEQRLKETLAKNLLSYPLFDTIKFVENLEQVYQDLISQ